LSGTGTGTGPGRDRAGTGDFARVSGTGMGGGMPEERMVLRWEERNEW